ncbi:MAG: carboxypeptidase regulatory-like domain-containing protein [Dehalococcoidia bacterium]|nr:carboxypeptidase regulatory-like domain-containing protein [Dehalococcoidia bacterium]
MRVAVSLAGVLLALTLALTARAAQASDVSVTTELRPGWNLAGWTPGETDVDMVFSALPPLLAIYAWDADEQRFTAAVRDGANTPGGLKTLTPGMGLFLYLGGEETAEWTRPHVPESLRVSLAPGWNLVAWSGINNTRLADGLAALGSSVTESWIWNPETGRAVAGGRSTDRRLKRGEGLWVNVSRELEWRQADVPVNLEFIGEFNEEERAAATERIEDAIDFFAHRFEIVVPNDLTIQVDAYWAAGCYYRSGSRTISVGGGLSAHGGCLLAMPHEYTHAVQHYLSSRTPDGRWGRVGGLRDAGPGWLLEGVATHVGALYDDYHGIAPFSDHLSAIEEAAGSHPNLLQEHPVYYGVGALAVLRLIDRAGEAALFDFYRSMSDRDSWEEVFHEVFGTAVDDFYREFEEYRAPLRAIHRDKQSELRRMQISGKVIGPDGNPVTNADIDVAFPDPTIGHSVEANQNGEFTVTLEHPGSYRVSLIARNTSCELGWYGGLSGFTEREDEAARIVLPAEEPTDLVIRLPRKVSEMCRTIRGIVVDREGEPVGGNPPTRDGTPNWAVIARVASPDSYHTGSGTVAADGRFEIVARAGHRYQFVLASTIVRECAVADSSSVTAPIFTLSDHVWDVRLIVVVGEEQPWDWNLWCRAEP